MTKQLAPSDLSSELYCNVEIGIEGLAKYDDYEQWPPPIKKSSEQVKWLSAHDIQTQYGVSAEVAEKLAAYQNDIQAAYKKAIEKLLEQSKRYMLVKPYLKNKRYEYNVLENFILWNMSMKDLEPARYLRNSITGVTTSYLILATAISLVKNPALHIPFDPIGGWILSIIWGLITLFVAVGIPGQYRARKLIVSLLEKDHS